ncbi:MAG: RES family NAD+ phosphorylase [Actinomycetota bacterium]|jgi:hypothetical protein|nr:RES family NAD+ phosphorylase [Actinomycetota bacterium]
MGRTDGEERAPDNGPDPPGAHPYPSDDFSEQVLPIREVTGTLFRLFPAAYDEPLHFGRSGDNRFDSPDGSYGVLYTAEDVLGAFIETFGRRLGKNLITGRELASKRLVGIDPAPPLKLIDLVGAGQSKAGVDGRLFTGSYSVSQAYSRAIYGHPACPDGIRYPARHDTQQVSVALFERARPSTKATLLGTLNESRNIGHLSRILGHYDQFGYKE